MGVMTGASQRWPEQAACLDMNTELFFPNGTTGPAVEQTIEAKAVCAHCPVVAQSLASALSMNEAGIWGGMTEEERRILRSRRRKRQ